MHHHVKAKLPNDDIEIFLKRDEFGAIVPVDRYGRSISGLKGTITEFEAGGQSTITITVYHRGWLDDIQDKNP